MLISLAHETSSQKNMRSHLQIFTQFRDDLGVTQFPVEGKTMFCYISHGYTSPLPMGK